MEKNSKKELKIVLSAELYDELRFTFRADQLENIIYLPEVLDEKKWQCCCGSESELDVCPICGMEKNTVLSKVNANYLARHRKARIARRRKAVQDQQAMMASQMIKKNKTKSDDKKKLGTFIGIIFLCVAILICAAIVFGGNDKDNPKKPVDTPVNTSELNPPETSDRQPDESKDTPDDTKAPDDTTPPQTDPVPTPVDIPSEPAEIDFLTIKDGAVSPGASGNTSVGGLLYSGDEFDYIAKDGIKVVDKSGNEAGVLTQNKALGITGSGTYIFYIDEQNTVHKADTKSQEDTAFAFKAKTICAYYDELYYIPLEESGLFACNFDGNKTKTLTKLNVYALNNTADKLYFSTDESLCVITSKDGNVKTFCPLGAKATSIIEITNCIFYTSADGNLRFYTPVNPDGTGVEYPRYNLSFTYVMAYEHRVYVRTYNQATGAIEWISTVWTPNTKLFAPDAFTSTGITTESLYVTNNAVYDGELNRR